MEPFDGLLREALIVCAVMCFPVLGAATLVGTIIAVVQAATQVQEQTLTLLPKLMVVTAVIALLGRFGFGLCAALFNDALGQLPAIVTSLR
jgi:flagellar biosynthesis protein FliQ